MLFPIPPTERTAPDAAGFPEAEEHVLTTADGEKVIVWHVPAKPGHPVVLYFHGNGDFLAGFFGRFRDLIADGTGLVALSYRGYAGSSGQPSEQGLLLDAAAAYAFTTARYGADRIVVWGFSLGTGVAVALAAEHPVGKLILEAPYTSTLDVAAVVCSDSCRFGWLMRDQFHSDQRIARVTAPLLIMHGAARSRRFRSPLASACSRSPTSRSNSSGFPEAATTISTILARSKRRDNSSMLRKADGCDCLAHSPLRRILRIWSHERTRPDAAIGMDFPGAGGAAVCRRHRARLRSRRRPAGWCLPWCCW